MARDVFTVVAPIKSSKALKALDDVLATINADLAGNEYLRLSPDQFPELHFASFVVFDPKTDGRMLAFENSVDGSRDTYLRRVAERPGIDAIFQHCTGYPERPDIEARFRFLRKRAKSPQLYHVSTPYRTARSIRDDEGKRQEMDTQIRGNSQLWSRQLVRPIAGVKQYWRWEIAKPWVAGIVPFPAIWLEARLYGSINWDGLVWRILAIIDMAVILISAALVAGSLWFGALPELRARYRRWIFALQVILAGVFWPWWAKWLFTNHLVLAIIATLAFTLLLGGGIPAAIRRRRAERIAELRVAAGGESLVPLWQALQGINKPPGKGTYVPERPGWMARLWNWKWWPVPPAVLLLPLLLLKEPEYFRALVAVLVVMFFLKAIWLAALTGWPLSATAIGRRTKGAIFTAVATVAGAILVESLFGLETHTLLLAVFLTAGLFLLWVLRVPSSEHPSGARPQDGLSPAAAATLRCVIDQEDRDVQNHMSLVAVVRSRWRWWTLRFFLFLLNHIFYRALLPDAWRGKLFGLPTVHCAQWVLLEDHRFLFLSNYDHSWNSYLDDFGEHLGPGIQKIWGQCIGNPGTADLGNFKRYVRESMVPYGVWYRAYPGLTVRQVWNNQHLRTALARDIPEEKVVQALRRLGAAPKVLPEILHAAQ